MIAGWDANVPYMAITIFEYDWLTGHKQTISYEVPGGVKFKHEFRAKFSNETFYKNMPTVLTNTNYLSTLDYFNGQSSLMGLCSTCTGAWICLDPTAGSCSGDYSQLEKQ